MEDWDLSSFLADVAEAERGISSLSFAAASQQPRAKKKRVAKKSTAGTASKRSASAAAQRPQSPLRDGAVRANPWYLKPVLEWSGDTRRFDEWGGGGGGGGVRGAAGGATAKKQRARKGQRRAGKTAAQRGMPPGPGPVLREGRDAVVKTKPAGGATAAVRAGTPALWRPGGGRRVSDATQERREHAAEHRRHVWRHEQMMAASASSSSSSSSSSHALVAPSSRSPLVAAKAAVAAVKQQQLQQQQQQQSPHDPRPKSAPMSGRAGVVSRLRADAAAGAVPTAGWRLLPRGPLHPHTNVIGVDASEPGAEEAAAAEEQQIQAAQAERKLQLVQQLWDRLKVPQPDRECFLASCVDLAPAPPATGTAEGEGDGADEAMVVARARTAAAQAQRAVHLHLMLLKAHLLATKGALRSVALREASVFALEGVLRHVSQWHRDSQRFEQWRELAAANGGRGGGGAKQQRQGRRREREQERLTLCEAATRQRVDVLEALVNVQAKSVGVAGAIVQWRQQLWLPRPFRWHGLDYASRIRSDVSAVLSNPAVAVALEAVGLPQGLLRRFLPVLFVPSPDDDAADAAEHGAGSDGEGGQRGGENGDWAVRFGAGGMWWNWEEVLANVDDCLRQPMMAATAVASAATAASQTTHAAVAAAAAILDADGASQQAARACDAELQRSLRGVGLRLPLLRWEPIVATDEGDGATGTAEWAAALEALQPFALGCWGVDKEACQRLIALSVNEQEIVKEVLEGDGELAQGNDAAQQHRQSVTVAKKKKKKKLKSKVLVENFSAPLIEVAADGESIHRHRHHEKTEQLHSGMVASSSASASFNVGHAAGSIGGNGTDSTRQQSGSLVASLHEGELREAEARARHFISTKCAMHVTLLQLITPASVRPARAAQTKALANAGFTRNDLVELLALALEPLPPLFGGGRLPAPIVTHQKRRNLVTTANAERTGISAGSVAISLRACCDLVLHVQVSLRARAALGRLCR